MGLPWESDEPWWDEEDDDWSEDSYYRALADYFSERYESVRKWIVSHNTECL